MKQNFRKSMVWLHTYSGLLLGWLIFTIWVTGTLSYFNSEISLWMKPELAYSQNKAGLIDRSLGLLHENGQEADRWRIVLPSKRDNLWSIEWRKDGKRESITLRPDTAKSVTPRDTEGGGFFRSFHYTLHLRSYGGRFFTGIAAMTFLIAIFTGIYTHRRFFKDFFSLRRVKTLTLLRDFHALVGIITIPVNVMLCLSALFIYVFLYMPASANYHYEGGERAVFREVIPSLPTFVADVPSVIPLQSFATVEQKIRQQWGGDNQITRITFEQPYLSNGRIIVERAKDKSLSNRAQRLVFSSTSGEALDGYPTNTFAAKVRRVLWGLHEAKFAPPVLRWLLFFLGVLSSAMIASGLIYWLKIRVQKAPSKSGAHWLVERLNIAVIAGLTLAIAAYFIANRLLPIGVVERSSLEIQVFFVTWFLAVLHAFLRSSTLAWTEQLGLSALAYLSVLLIDLVQDSQRLINAVLQTNWPYLGFSLSMLVVSTALFLCVIALRKTYSQTTLSTSKVVN